MPTRMRFIQISPSLRGAAKTTPRAVPGEGEGPRLWVADSTLADLRRPMVLVRRISLAGLEALADAGGSVPQLRKEALEGQLQGHGRRGKAYGDGRQHALVDDDRDRNADLLGNAPGMNGSG